MTVAGFFDAIFRGDAAAVQEGISQGLVNTTSEGWTPLHLAAGRRNAEIVKMLIRAGADPKAKGSSGGIPLHDAVISGTAKITAVLIAEGSDPRAKSKSGRTPLHHALDRFCTMTEIIKMLIRAGCDLGVKGQNGRTLLHEAAEYGTPRS